MRRHRGRLCPFAWPFLALVLPACGASSRTDKDAPVTVAAEVAARDAQPITVTGLGQIQGFYTADARAQTSGQIVRTLFTEGQPVSAGQPLAQIDPRPLQASLAIEKAQLERDSAALAGARDLFKRTAPLVKQGLASAQQVEGYRTQVAQLSAAVAGGRAAVTRDKLTLDYATIRAPISGIAGVRKVDPGNVVTPADKEGIVTIAQVQPIALLFSVPQKDLVAIQQAIVSAGGKKLGVTAMSQDGGVTLDTGALGVVDNRIDSANGTVQLKATFPNTKRNLWPGQLVMARLQLATRPNVVSVASSSIQRNPDGSFVWIVVNGQAQQRSVITGTTIADRTIVAKGLSGGERVVTDGQFGLTAGTRVTVGKADRETAPLRSDDPHKLGIVP